MASDRIVVAAYHDVGVRCLGELLRQGAPVAAVFTHEDAAGEEIWFSSVRELAARHGIPCRTDDINAPESLALMENIAPDFLFSFYYRLMMGKEVLGVPRRGALNMHGSLLPKYRGRVPVNWAVINGETETGATLHYMVEKPDAGDMVDQARVPIAFTDTVLDVFRKVTEAAGLVMARSWPLLSSGTAPRRPMDLSRGSYCGGRKPADGLVDWTRSAVAIYNLVRGVTHPYPGAFTTLDRRKIFIWRSRPHRAHQDHKEGGAASRPVEGEDAPGVVVSERPLLVGTGSGLLEARSLQVEGEPELEAPDFIARHPLAGMRFGGATPAPHFVSREKK
jgi:methionyl-tRNA formyltransferase